MKINLKGTNIGLTTAISEYLDKRLEGVEKFIPAGKTYIADVELGRTTKHHQAGDIFRAEINIHIGSRSFRAVSEQQDLYSAIDDMKAEITRELGVDKEKKISFLRRGGQKLKNILKGNFHDQEL
jgi:ribosomal subunit interface protein